MMREATYNATFSSKLEKEVGGQVIKIADKTTLGLPDSLHIMDGVTTFFEVKCNNVENAVTHHNKIPACRPWDSMNDIRQYEVCKRLAKHVTVLYIIYYPIAFMTAVLPIEELEKYNRRIHVQPEYYLQRGLFFVDGHGIDAFNIVRLKKRRELYDKLQRENI